MTDESLKKRLNALVNADKRNAFDRLAAVYPEVRAAMDAGATRVQVLEALKAEGIEIAAHTLTMYLQRLRKLEGQVVASAKRRGKPVPAQPLLDAADDDVVREEEPGGDEGRESDVQESQPKRAQGGNSK